MDFLFKAVILLCLPPTSIFIYFSPWMWHRLKSFPRKILDTYRTHDPAGRCLFFNIFLSVKPEINKSCVLDSTDGWCLHSYIHEGVIGWYWWSHAAPTANQMHRILTCWIPLKMFYHMHSFSCWTLFNRYSCRDLKCFQFALSLRVSCHGPIVMFF